MGLRPSQPIHRGDPAFRQLRENVHPSTGGKLTQRNRSDSTRFFDFQCSAQKSVSLLHALTNDRRLAHAHDLAAAKAFAELESFAACRVRAGNAAWSQQSRVTGHLCAAVFRHDTSRALDPQLHTHFVVANATWDGRDGRMVALENRPMYQALRYAGKVYQNELAREVRALGYDTVDVRNARGVIEGFEIEGVSDKVRERFSKRRVEVEAGIEKFTAKHGRDPSRAEINVITRQTRSAKMAETSTPAVRVAQVAQLSAAEHEQLLALTSKAHDCSRIRRSDLPTSPLQTERAKVAIQAAAAHHYERASVLTGHELLAEALNTSLGTLDLDQLKRSIAEGQADLVALEQADDRSLLTARYATRAGLATERGSVAFVNQTKNCHPPLLPPDITVAEWLAEEQKQVVRFVGACRDQVMAIRGVAGAGKTTLLQELDGHLVRAGERLLYLAPTTAAVRVLASEGFAQAATVSEYLVRSKSGDSPIPQGNTVLVVDEAGLASNRQGADLLNLARTAGQRVIFVGDSRQHTSVEAGDFLRVLETHSNLATCELKDIRRQQRAEYRAAAKQFSVGRAAVGMELLDRLGWVREAGGEYLAAAAEEYLRLVAAASPKESVLCVAPTWAENYELTHHIRAGRQTTGDLGAAHELSVLDPLGWSGQQRRTLALYQPGMVITFNRRTRGGFTKGASHEIERIEDGGLVLAGGKWLGLAQAEGFDVARWRTIELAGGDKILLRANDKKRGLVNGDVLTVSRVLADGVLETQEGKLIPVDYRHLSHGYVVTSHKSQGRTADHIVVAAARLDGRSAYVACTRGRQSCAVFAPDKASLFAGLPRAAERLAALDVLGAQNPGTKERPPATTHVPLHDQEDKHGCAASADNSLVNSIWATMEAPRLASFLCTGTIRADRFDSAGHLTDIAVVGAEGSEDLRIRLDQPVSRQTLVALGCGHVIAAFPDPAPELSTFTSLQNAPTPSDTDQSHAEFIRTRSAVAAEFEQREQTAQRRERKPRSRQRSTEAFVRAGEWIARLAHAAIAVAGASQRFALACYGRKRDESDRRASVDRPAPLRQCAVPSGQISDPVSAGRRQTQPGHSALAPGLPVAAGEFPPRRSGGDQPAAANHPRTSALDGAGTRSESDQTPRLAGASALRAQSRSPGEPVEHDSRDTAARADALPGVRSLLPTADPGRRASPSRLGQTGRARRGGTGGSGHAGNPDATAQTQGRSGADHRPGPGSLSREGASSSPTYAAQPSDPLPPVVKPTVDASIVSVPIRGEGLDSVVDDAHAVTRLTAEDNTPAGEETVDPARWLPAYLREEEPTPEPEENLGQGI